MTSALQFSLQPLQYALNFAIRLDPQTHARMAQFENKVIAFDIAELPFTLFLQGTKENFLVTHTISPVTADVTLQGSLFAFLRYLVHQTPVKAFSNKELTLIGDTALAQDLLHFLSGLEIDWEEQLSRGIGDVAAHSFFHFFKRTTAWGKKTTQSFANTTIEYLEEEATLLAPRAAIEDFITQVDILRDDVARLEARLSHLGSDNANH